MGTGEAGDRRALRIATLLLVVASITSTAFLVAAVGWYRSAYRAPSLHDLSPADRERLVRAALEVSPSGHEWAWFEPRIGYTLSPSRRLTLWNDTFRTNALGYRAGEPEKRPGVLRVVFVGDSWTYGMGVSRQEAFPAVFERLANAHAELPHPVEAWTLALPGYNTWNQLAALWFFFDQLDPDVVVLAPSSNDNDSTAAVLSNGSPWRGAQVPDLFGDPHTVTYRAPRLVSHRYLERWREVLREVRDTEQRLEALGVPLLFHFVARWETAVAHQWMTAGRLRSPYVVVPPHLTLGEWRNPLPLDHGTPAAHELYGHLAYRGVAHRLGWPEIPLPAELAGTQVFDGPPPGDWIATAGRRSLALTRRQIPDSLRPPAVERAQMAGIFDPRSGLMGRATTLLVQRREGASTLRVEVRRLAGIRGLYPLTLTVRIPAAGGDSSEATLLIPADGPDRLSVELPIPPSIAPGVAIDVVLVASRAAATGDVLAGRSLEIVAIEQR